MPKDRKFTGEDDAEAEVNRLREEKRTILSFPNQRASEAGQQEQTVQSYAGRALIELLQNAVDANREIPIGYKGLGFRSVLNLTDAPEIHSGHLHVRWSPENAHEAVGAAAEKLPVLAFPQWWPDSTERVDSYATSVVLPLKESARQDIQDEWSRLMSDPSVIVFIDGVDELIWDAGEGKRLTWCRSQMNDIVTIVATVADQPPVAQRWRVHRVGEAAVAIPLDVSGALLVRQEQGATNFRCYFPTEDTNPFGNVLVHAAFPLTLDRKKLDCAHPNTAKRITEIADAMAAAASQLGVVEILDLLQTGWTGDAARDRVETKLVLAVKQAIAGCALVGLRCCPQREQLPYGFWDSARRLSLWERFKACLARYRPGELDGLSLLPLGSETPTREKTLLWLNPNAGLTKGELRGLHWAKADGESVPCNSSVLFAPPSGEALVPPIPPGIALHFLDREFYQDASKKLGNEVARSLFRDTLGVRDFRISEVITHAVLPVLEAGDEPVGIVEFLYALWCRAERGERGDFDWNEQWRARLIRACKVRCSDGGLRSTLETYAGSDWTGSDFLARCYGDRADRVFLHAPPDDPELRESCAAFYRWLGVGWAPKIFPLLLEGDTTKTKRGWLWADGRFVVAGEEPPNWRDYCADAWARRYQASDFTYRTPRLKLDWTLDGGEKVVEQGGAFEAVHATWSYYARYAESVCYWSSNQQQDYDNERKSTVSYFLWRLRSLRWLPAGEPPELHRPVDVFSPGEVALSHAMSGWVSPLGKDVPDKIANLLAIRRYWKEVTLDDWRRWLRAAETLNPQERIEDRDRIRRLYACLLTNAERGDAQNPLMSCKLWWVERLADCENWTLATATRARGAYLDRPELESLFLQGIVICPARLDDKAAKAEALFGIPHLSHRIVGVPNSDGEWRVSGMTERIQSRMPYLVAYLGIARNEQGRDELRAALAIIEVIETAKLAVTWTRKLDGSVIATVEQTSFARHDGDRWRLHLRATSAPTEVNPGWERLAEVILLSCGFPSTEKAANVRDILIYAEDRLREKLTNLGVAPETVGDAQRMAFEQRPTVVTPPSVPDAPAVPPPPIPPNGPTPVVQPPLVRPPPAIVIPPLLRLA